MPKKQLPRMPRHEPVLKSRPIFLRISTVVSPDAFLAVEIPNGEHELPDFEWTDLASVWRLEKELGAMYNAKTLESMEAGILQVEDLVPDRLVAVRKTSTNPYWYRAKILSVASKPTSGSVLEVYLIDYGKYYYQVADTDVRELPDAMHESPPPLAREVCLAGLRPVTMDLDHARGIKTMTPVVSDAWDPAALDHVKGLVKATRTGFAHLTDWVKDYRGRLHGQVNLFLTQKDKLCLNQDLIDNDFAIYDKNSLMNAIRRPTKCDLDTSALSSIGSLSICGRDREGAVSAEPEETSIDTANVQAYESAPISSAPPKIRKVGKWISVPNLPKKDDEEKESEASGVCSAPTGARRKMNLKELLSRKKQDESVSDITVDTTESSIWQSFRKEPVQKSEDRPEPKFAHPIMIPAGTDLGQDLEERLKAVKSYGKGPKKLQPM